MELLGLNHSWSQGVSPLPRLLWWWFNLLPTQSDVNPSQLQPINLSYCSLSLLVSWQTQIIVYYLLCCTFTYLKGIIMYLFHSPQTKSSHFSLYLLAGLICYTSGCSCCCPLDSLCSTARSQGPGSVPGRWAQSRWRASTMCRECVGWHTSACSNMICLQANPPPSSSTTRRDSVHTVLGRGVIWWGS